MLLYLFCPFRHVLGSLGAVGGCQGRAKRAASAGAKMGLGPRLQRSLMRGISAHGMMRSPSQHLILRTGERSERNIRLVPRRIEALKVRTNRASSDPGGSLLDKSGMSSRSVTASSSLGTVTATRPRQ